MVQDEQTLTVGLAGFGRKHGFLSPCNCAILCWRDLGHPSLSYSQKHTEGSPEECVPKPDCTRKIGQKWGPRIDNFNSGLEAWGSWLCVRKALFYLLGLCNWEQQSLAPANQSQRATGSKRGKWEPWTAKPETAPGIQVCRPTRESLLFGRLILIIIDRLWSHASGWEVSSRKHHRDWL